MNFQNVQKTSLYSQCQKCYSVQEHNWAVGGGYVLQKSATCGKIGHKMRDKMNLLNKKILINMLLETKIQGKYKNIYN